MLLRLQLLLYTLLFLRLLDSIKLSQGQGEKLCISLPLLCQQALNIIGLSFCYFHDSILNQK